jgi:hypothetical protein
MGAPLEMPPRMPPALLDTRGAPAGTRGSLFSDPVIRAAANPAPISTPLTAPTP